MIKALGFPIVIVLLTILLWEFKIIPAFDSMISIIQEHEEIASISKVEASSLATEKNGWIKVKTGLSILIYALCSSCLFSGYFGFKSGVKKYSFLSEKSENSN